MSERHADTPQAIDAVIAKTSKQSKIDALIAASPSVLLLRDGGLVLYRRTRSLLYQCRFKLADGKWHRFSTRKASLENAIAAACDRYDEARYRQRLGLAHRTHTYARNAAMSLASQRTRERQHRTLYWLRYSLGFKLLGGIYLIQKKYIILNISNNKNQFDCGEGG
jgi:hypothetical protein